MLLHQRLRRTGLKLLFRTFLLFCFTRWSGGFCCCAKLRRLVLLKLALEDLRRLVLLLQRLRRRLRLVLLGQRRLLALARRRLLLVLLALNLQTRLRRSLLLRQCLGRKFLLLHGVRWSLLALIQTIRRGHVLLLLALKVRRLNSQLLRQRLRRKLGLRKSCELLMHRRLRLQHLLLLLLLDLSDGRRPLALKVQRRLARKVGKWWLLALKVQRRLPLVLLDPRRRHGRKFLFLCEARRRLQAP